MMVEKDEVRKRLARAHYTSEPGIRQIFTFLGKPEEEMLPGEPIKINGLFTSGLQIDQSLEAIQLSQIQPPAPGAVSAPIKGEERAIRPNQVSWPNFQAGRKQGLGGMSMRLLDEHG
jgi:hypothetical protein